MKEGLIYWIHLKEHTDPYKEGYVGVTRNLEKRIREHKNRALNKTHNNKRLAYHLLNNEIFVDVLMKSEETVCYDIEKQYRPEEAIGWNMLCGGKIVNNSYAKVENIKPKSEEFKQHRRELMMGNTRGSGNKGKPKTLEHKQKISLSNKGRIISEEQKRKQSLTMKNRKASQETKDKISASSKGKKRGPYKKKEINVDL